MIDIKNLSDQTIDLLRDAWWEGYDVGVDQCGVDEGFPTKGGLRRNENSYDKVIDSRQEKRFAAMERAVQTLLEKRYGPAAEEAFEELRALCKN